MTEDLRLEDFYPIDEPRAYEEYTKYLNRVEMRGSAEWLKVSQDVHVINHPKEYSEKYRAYCLNMLPNKVVEIIRGLKDG